MRTRAPGQGLEVSALGLGCMGMSYGHERPDENLGSLELELTVAELADIEVAASRIRIHGTRRPGTDSAQPMFKNE
jgi:hypothetical protein